jgi:Flp pilus assembly protein TadD
MRVAVVIAALTVAVLSLGCLEPPGVGRAADPGKAPGPAPWGSATSNAELDKKLTLLNDILDAKIKNEDFAARLQKDWPELSDEQRKRTLAGVLQLQEDLVRSGRAGTAVEAGPDRDMAVAQLYFSERRFIEAGTLLSKILDKNPTYPNARNLLARCFFFLGNRDRTIQELEFVLTNEEHQKDKEEMLDALFLMGAAVAETPGMSRENLEKAKGAWETYKKLAPPDSPMIAHIEKGMPDIEAGLRGEGPLAQPLVPVGSEGGDDGSDSRGALGGGGNRPPMAGGGDAPPTSPAERRVNKLPKDAPQIVVLIAEGWDALDANNVALAEEKLSAAAAIDKKNAELLVGLGRVYVKTGRVDEALRSFGEAIKLDDSFMPAWHYNGMAHMLSGDPTQAVTSWEKIKQKDPAYFAKYNLDKRIEVAKRMAQ